MHARWTALAVVVEMAAVSVVVMEVPGHGGIEDDDCSNNACW